MDNIEKSLAEEKILRDYLAIDRTRLANERTLLAFLRTSLYLLATALAIIELESLQNIRFLAWIMIAGSVASLIIGIVNYLRMRYKINNMYLEGSEAEKNKK